MTKLLEVQVYPPVSAGERVLVAAVLATSWCKASTVVVLLLPSPEYFASRKQSLRPSPLVVVEILELWYLWGIVVSTFI